MSALAERAAMTLRMTIQASPIDVTANNNASVKVQAKAVLDGRSGRRLQLQLDEAVPRALSLPGSRSMADSRHLSIKTR